MDPKRHEVDHARLAEIADRAGADAGGVPAEWLRQYLPLLADVSRTGRRPDAAELSSMRACGESAARDGVPLRAIIDVHLSATWMAWPLLPGIAGSRRAEELRSAGEAVFRAADRSIVALVEGYERAQRMMIRREEALRREFIDDLLHGRRDLGALAERAARFGLRLAGSHVVAIAEAERPFYDGGPVSRHVEASLLNRFGLQDLMVATKEGLLVCVSSGYVEGVSEAFASLVQDMMTDDPSLRVAVGRAHHGPGGVVRSFEEARNVVALARRLQLPERVLRASDLLVLQVLLRDQAAITELVEAVLGPLRAARGGPGTLLETLFAYFATGGVATLTAGRLHVGVRTVTYRLERVRELTGYRLDNPIQRHALETATLGARLLGWPAETVTRPSAP
ncbi:PucR family transcriptional regulator [Nonomuraea terrae]|uniref:PucR family transcriptional regulator n=1 Tax=Nonomuraea terrae TaxID=2530383 RepID=A0A4V2YJF8_9ACTN|nr:helix-turn-helix domain-containing protein [Nonomuraea terrae]TDD38737.1 PucR family transcriptional regulator [Nonomuraea terrae]